METQEIKGPGGMIDLTTARNKKAAYLQFKYDTGLGGQTDFIIFDRVKLQDWLVNLSSNATQVLVYLGLEEEELDVFFWPYNSSNQKSEDVDGMLEKGYNIGDRQPLAPYEL